MDAKRSDADVLQGVWVFETAATGKNPATQMVWTSTLTVAGDAVTLAGLLDSKTPLRGTVTWDPSAEPKRCDLTLPGLDLAGAGVPVTIAAGHYLGIYKRDGDRLTVCWGTRAGGRRPAAFDAADAVQATLVRAPADFKRFPADVTVTAVGPDGRPVPGAVVTTYLERRQPVSFLGADGKPADPAKLTDEQRTLLEGQDKLPDGAVRDDETGWVYHDVQRTGADGTARLRYDQAPAAVVVRDPATKRMGVGTASPASVLRGPVVVRLEPECRVHITATCDELTRAGRGGQDSFSAYVLTAGRQRIAFLDDVRGSFDCRLPPGEYLLTVYGSEVMGSRTVTLTVPRGRGEYTAPAVAVPPTELAGLVGQPAPELSDVAAWKGPPTTLADLKGKYVLVEFWGYWCGPCVGSLPVLFELHDKYKDRGVAVVGVHVDVDGEVDTAKTLDEKLATYRKGVWNGRDIPFPVALTSSRVVAGGDEDNASRGPLAGKFGVRSYPTTLLIDREGKVVGTFYAGDAGLAVMQLDGLLKDEKK